MEQQVVTQPKLGERAKDALAHAQSSKLERRAQIEMVRHGELRGRLVVWIKDAIDVVVDPKDVRIPVGPQHYIGAHVDVDDVTLALVGYPVRNLRVLYRCEACKCTKPSQTVITTLTALGFELSKPRTLEGCRCRPGGEVLRTGGVRVGDR